jgi:L-ascorbate metabolism protein UlaG (beta-lactamase superfamily)
MATGSNSKITMTPPAPIQQLSSRKHNPDLKTVLPSWEGTPVDQKGRFMNYEFPFLAGFGSVFKWMMQSNPQKAFKNEDPWRMPVLKDDAFLNSKEDTIVPLGHATFFIRLGGKQILIDPVFGKIPATKRHSEFPVDPLKLTNLDYILVSHAHYDHCDKNSLKLLQQLNPQARFLTGLGMGNILKRWTKDNIIEEAGWFQQYNTDSAVDIIFVTSRHWSNRTPADTNKSLWGGFVLKTKDKTVYFGGDSGYGSHFNLIGELFPGIDVAMLGVGAYMPKWFMSPMHQDPESAVQAFHDTGAKTMIPFHYGTFDMSDEPLSEPERILKTLEQAGKINGVLKIMPLGSGCRI